MDNVRKKQQQINKILGYGDDSIEFKKKNYNITLKMLNKEKKIQELKDKSNENIYISSMQRKFNSNDKF